MYILGINSAYHEPSACLVKDGKIVGFVEEERLTRYKHGKTAKVDNASSIPKKAINWCLNKAGISINDVSHVAYSFLPKERWVKNKKHKHPYFIKNGEFGSDSGEDIFYEDNLKVKDLITELGFSGEFHFLSHHACHAASAFFVSHYNESAVLVIDGIGEYASTTMYYGYDNKIEALHEIVYPNSLGLFWEKMSKFLGFDAYGASKVMGLAGYGDNSVFKKIFRKLIKPDGYSSFFVDDTLMKLRIDDYSDLEELFMVSRKNEPIRRVDKNNKVYANIAASLQDVTEEIVTKLLIDLKEMTNSDNLCMAGGIALNCAMNEKLINKRIFNNIFMQPAAHDAGTSIGAAYIVWNQVLNNPKNYTMDTPFLGPSYEFEETLCDSLGENISCCYLKNIEKEAAQLIARGKVVGWFQGNIEAGPRALGNRSILSDPRRSDLIVKLNSVKHREEFRPYCPSVLEEKAKDWFLVNHAQPYELMMAACQVGKNKANQIPAVVHVDGTSRIQLVNKSHNPKYYKLINEFYKLTGVPLVLNTSFNDLEPIVCSPEDAIKVFIENSVDVLIIGNYLISKN